MAWCKNKNARACFQKYFEKFLPYIIYWNINNRLRLIFIFFLELTGGFFCLVSACNSLQIKVLFTYFLYTLVQKMKCFLLEM